MIPQQQKFQQSQTGMNTAGMNTAQSFKSLKISHKHLTSLDQGDLANILHNCRNSVQDLNTSMNTGLTSGVVGLSFLGRQGSVPQPINVSHAPQAAPPCPYTSDQSQPPHLASQSENLHVP